MALLFEKYQKEIAPALQEKFAFKNVHQIPKIEKIVINVGAGEAVQNPKCLDVIHEYLSAISGQKCTNRKAKKSIASFKLREGMTIGVSVTLRRQRMYDFLERLISVALPRVRDFKGVSRKAFDGKGNYSLGLKEQLVFPEVNYDEIDKIRGMNITIVTSSETNDEGLALLEQFGFPFRKN